MSKLVSSSVLFALQLCLCLWQLIKITQVGFLIQGITGWLLRPLRLSPTYSRLQRCGGRVFKRVNCFALQPCIPSEGRGIVRDEVSAITLHYLGSYFLLERQSDTLDVNHLRLDRKVNRVAIDYSKPNMRCSITPIIWNELQTLEEVLHNGIVGPRTARVACAAQDPAKANVRPVIADTLFVKGNIPVMAAPNCPNAVFLKGNMEFCEEVIVGRVITLEEVLDAVLQRKQVIVPLNNEWFLPVGYMSEENCLKFINLAAMFLQGTLAHSYIVDPYIYIVGVQHDN